MPPDLDTPATAVVQAAMALAGGDPAACADHLRRAHDLTDDDLGVRTWARRLSVLLTDLARARGCGHLVAARSVAEIAETTIAHMRGLGIDVPADVHATVLLGKADGLLWHGEFGAAGHALTAALREPEEAPAARVQAACLGRLALVEALGGRLRRATDLARRAHLLADRFDLPAADRPAAADVALAWVGTEEYELPAARVHANRAGAALAGRYDPLSAAPLALVRARIRRARGDRPGTGDVVQPVAPASATAPPAWITDLYTVAAATQPGPADATPEVESATSALESATSPRGVLARATAALAAGDVPATQQTATALLRDPDLPHDVRVDCWLLIAAAELAENRPLRARAALVHALGAAEAERLRRPVLDAPPQLLRFLRQDRRLCERHGWLGPAVLAAAPAADADPAGTRPSAVIVEPLTARETEVLTHLAALYSTEEIARSMYLSVNTVKTHVRGVLRKLAASRRNEAVRRARELGLIGNRWSGPTRRS
jgi:LuxR family maltose regulon positive regulatory protein